MLLTDYLERNARLYGMETALVEINPSEERDKAVTWREFNLIENANPDAPGRTALLTCFCPAASSAAPRWPSC